MSDAPPPVAVRPARPFWRAVLGGLGILLPPLLTIAVFIWVSGSVNFYLLQPIHGISRQLIVWRIQDVRRELPAGKPSPGDATVWTEHGAAYKRLSRGDFVPLEVYQRAAPNLPDNPTWRQVYEEYVDQEHLQWYVVVPVFLCVFLLVLYVLGKFIAAEIGQLMWTLFEGFVRRLPLVRSVYNAVKQVTDFMLTQTEVRFTRVVAVEYPRVGCWGLGFVMGDGMLDVSAAANEATISVLIPTSPAPLTGFACMFKRSEVVDLDITIDQALQYIVSCGVVLPPSQLDALSSKMRRDRKKTPSTGGEK